MRTDYRRLPDARAVLDVVVIHPFTHEQIPVEMMVDTGAATSSLPDSYMGRLGITPAMCAHREVAGVAKDEWPEWWGPLEMHVAGRRVYTGLLFSPPTAIGVGIAGRDFLRWGQLVFDLAHGRIAFHPHPDVERLQPVGLEVSA